MKTNNQYLRMALSLVRMTVQVGVMSALFFLLWHYDSLWLNLLWLLLMAVIAAWELTRRVKLQPKAMLLPLAASMVISVVPIAMIVLWILVREGNPLSARWLVPVSAVLMANVLTMGIGGLHDYFSSLHTDSLPYYTSLGNGGSRLEALKPYFVHALTAMASPAANQLSVVALFAVPMLLSGMLLGGMSPVAAGIAFVVLVVAGLLASAFFLLVAVCLSDRHIFDRRGQQRIDINT